MRTITAAAAFLLAAGAAHAETLYYGSRAGMEVTVVKKSNLNTTHAKITVKHTRENAITFCREYVGKVTEKCIKEELSSDLASQIEANCKTGKFTTIAAGGYQFLGPNPDYDPTGTNTEYLIVEAGGSEPLEGYSATGYDVALDQFKAMCPDRVQ
jgi:hypothetical protein